MLKIVVFLQHLKILWNFFQNINKYSLEIDKQQSINNNKRKKHEKQTFIVYSFNW